VVFERDPRKVALDQEAFDSLNWKQTFIRGVVQGYAYYAADPERARFDGLTADEFKEFFFDVRQLGVDLNFLDPNDAEIWSSTFEESKIFMLASAAPREGELKRMNFFEGVDLISYALSATKMSRRVVSDLQARCAHRENDVFGIPKVEPKCYRERFRASFADNYRWLPAWVDFASKLSTREWEAFQREIEQAARHKGYSDALIESTDIDRGTMVFHYIESVFVRFDQDGSGTISLEEARSAFPLLRGPLAEASGYSDDETLFAIFTYLLAYGEKPESLVDKLYFKFIWMLRPQDWKFEADRRRLLQIVAGLRSVKRLAP